MNNGHRHSSRRPSIWTGRASRLVLAAVFALWIHYIPFHLASEPHFHCAASIAHGTHHHHAGEHHDFGHEGHDGHHEPHPAAEHSVQARPESGPQFVCPACPPGDILAFPVESEFKPAFFVAKRLKRPGESPPGSPQSRAPPLV